MVTRRVFRLSTLAIGPSEYYRWRLILLAAVARRMPVSLVVRVATVRSTAVAPSAAPRVREIVDRV